MCRVATAWFCRQNIAESHDKASINVMGWNDNWPASGNAQYGENLLLATGLMADAESETLHFLFACL